MTDNSNKIRKKWLMQYTCNRICRYQNKRNYPKIKLPFTPVLLLKTAITVPQQSAL